MTKSSTTKNGNFKIGFSEYRIMKHIQKTCKGYENILEAVKK